MEGEWFRWVIGIVVTLQTGVIGVMAGLCWNMQKTLGVLDKRIALQEEREHIDPIGYTKVITEFSMTITALTQKVMEHITNFERQMGELRKGFQELQRIVEKQSLGRSI